MFFPSVRDPCLSNPCPADSTCTRTIEGTYICLCGDGSTTTTQCQGDLRNYCNIQCFLCPRSNVLNVLDSNAAVLVVSLLLTISQKLCLSGRYCLYLLTICSDIVLIKSSLVGRRGVVGRAFACGAEGFRSGERKTLSLSLSLSVHPAANG